MCMILSSLGGLETLLVPQGFVLPQVTLGKRPHTQQGRAFLISTSLCAFLGNVRFHEIQDLLLGHYNYTLSKPYNLSVSLIYFTCTFHEMDKNIAKDQALPHLPQYSCQQPCWNPLRWLLFLQEPLCQYEGFGYKDSGHCQSIWIILCFLLWFEAMNFDSFEFEFVCYVWGLGLKSLRGLLSEVRWGRTKC